MSERDELEAEREFQDYLKRKRAPFARPAEELEPPEALDRWVLQRATDGIRASEQPKPLRTMSWAVPFATAATVIIAIGVFLNVDHAPPGTAPSEVAAIPAARDTSAPVAASAPAESPVTVELQQEVANEPVLAEVQIAPAEQPAAAAQSAEAERDSFALQREQRALADQAMAKAEPTTPRGEFAPPPAAPPPAAAAPQPMSVGNAAIAAATDSAAESAADASVSQSMARRLSGAAVPDYRADADQWWREIERLRALGDREAAARELVEFRKAHPRDERGILPASTP